MKTHIATTIPDCQNPKRMYATSIRLLFWCWLWKGLHREHHMEDAKVKYRRYLAAGEQVAFRYYEQNTRVGPPDRRG